MSVSAQENMLRSLFACALETAGSMPRIREVLPKKLEGRVIVIGAEKASARKAETVEPVWGSCEGLIITRQPWGSN